MNNDAGGHHGVREDHRAGAHDRICADSRSREDDRPNPDESARFNRHRLVRQSQALSFVSEDYGLNTDHDVWSNDNPGGVGNRRSVSGEEALMYGRPHSAKKEVPRP